MPVVHFSTSIFPAAERAIRVRDEVGGHFLPVKITPAQLGPFRLDLSVVAGNTLIFANAHVGGIDVQRDQSTLSDGNDAVTCWINSGEPARADHNGHRRLLGAGQALLISHSRPGRSWWTDSHVTLLRIPREAFADRGSVDAAYGQTHAATRPVLKLLRAYLRSVWRAATDAGSVASEAERNIVAMVGALVATSPDGMRRAAWPALGPARVAAMQEVIARQATQPGLHMRAVAAAVGLSERSGHLALATAGLTFTELVTEARMQHVVARLRSGEAGRIIDVALDAGFGDVAHFNRLFRRRFGMTPRDMLQRG